MSNLTRLFPAATLMAFAASLIGIPVAMPAAPRPDVLIADFEGPDYGDWKAEGEAFGTGPARGALPGQMSVGGYLGKGLVNSFLRGDVTTGTLTSPPVRLERRYVNFLLGGGQHPGQTGVDLLIDGKVVRTATGPNDRPGGTEQLEWHSWDVTDLEGKTAVFRIVDQHTGGWGHINVDHIVMSDRKQQEEPAAREITVEKQYLHLPVKRGAPKRRLRFGVNDKTVREFEIELAEEQPDFWVFSDVSAFRGQRLRIAVDRLRTGEAALARIAQADALPDADALYREAHRPQFHFTSRRGWLNDPNGMVYANGEYHLFYQHNPYGWDWGNMHWGHATSRDMVHWREQPEALYPRQFGDWAFSGSAVVDKENTSGFRQGKGDVIVAAYTSTGRGECIVYSNDNGRTWTEYEGNPVVRHTGRDPRLLWHAPTRRWVMAVYNEDGGARDIVFHTSPDLKRWEYRSRISGFFECPDIFELPVQGDEGARRWVLYGADGKYLLGEFDGSVFRPEGGKQRLWHGNFYAAQTFSNMPDGRRVQIGWGQGIAFPGMPFNQQMTVPVQLTLRRGEGGVRMHAEPVRELEQLRGERRSRRDLAVKPGEKPQRLAEGETLDIVAEIRPAAGGSVTLTVRGVPITYDAAKGELVCGSVKAPLALEEGRLRLRVLVDRGSIEVFANRGRVALSLGTIPPADERGVDISAGEGPARLVSLQVHELRSIWK